MPEANIKPVPVPRRELDASELLMEDPSLPSRLLVSFEAPAQKQQRVTLGDYSLDDGQPIGFKIEVHPKENTEDVTAQITRLESQVNEYELVLHLANYGNDGLGIDVFEITRGSSA